jgi:hypothetical protein
VYRGPISFSGLTANGAANTATTTELYLTFGAPGISDLAAGEIQLTPNGTGAQPEQLIKNSATSYTLKVNGITQADSVTVRIDKNGYTTDPQARTIAVHRAAASGGGANGGGPVVANPDSTSLKLKFGVQSEGSTGVRDTFIKVHEYIVAGGLNNPSTNVIKLGDWIDLEGGLHVNSYNGEGGFTTIANASATNGTPLLRLIVVGINSFKGKNGNGTTPHVVFQFKNIPVFRRMEATDTNANGYWGSEMRKYLAPTGDSGSGRFLDGLIEAGVPDAVLWVPVRKTANKGLGATYSHTITDKLWLPTEYEIYGRNYRADPAKESTKAWLEYYTDFGRIGEKAATSSSRWYWLASPEESGTGSFCHIYGGSGNFDGSAGNVGGVVPAFCVQ